MGEIASNRNNRHIPNLATDQEVDSPAMLKHPWQL